MGGAALGGAALGAVDELAAREEGGDALLAALGASGFASEVLSGVALAAALDLGAAAGAGARAGAGAAVGAGAGAASGGGETGRGGASTAGLVTGTRRLEPMSCEPACRPGKMQPS